ncbi:MAG TPA: hypothetical protein PKM63_12790 [Panacibacter sp.]|nr:hypothetical protein [Panacibacter sp.]HNP45158.1 hypothetical protein [Panacibacter sp.]
MEELENILNNEDDLSQDQLKKYLSGEAGPDDIFAVERGMVESEFIDDAVEGLQAFSSESKLEHFVDEINKNLGIQLQERKQKKEKRKIKNLLWGIIAVIVILSIAIICFMVIRMLKERDVQKTSVQIPGNYMSANRKAPEIIL